MAYIKTYRRASGGGGQALAWALDSFPQEDPFSSGLTLNLSQTPLSANAIVVWSQGLPLNPDDWNYAAGVVTILFSGDPAVDYPETGIWTFTVQYPYAT